MWLHNYNTIFFFPFRFCLETLRFRWDVNTAHLLDIHKSLILNKVLWKWFIGTALYFTWLTLTIKKTYRTANVHKYSIPLCSFFSVLFCVSGNDIPLETNLLITPWSTWWQSLQRPKNKISIRSSILLVWKWTEKNIVTKGYEPKFNLLMHINEVGSLAPGLHSFPVNYF